MNSLGNSLSLSERLMLGMMLVCRDREPAAFTGKSGKTETKSGITGDKEKVNAPRQYYCDFYKVTHLQKVKSICLNVVIIRILCILPENVFHGVPLSMQNYKKYYKYYPGANLFICNPQEFWSCNRSCLYG